MQVSVVIPFHRVTSYLEEALESVAMQEADDLEVVLVNNGAPESGERIACLFRDRLRMRLVRLPYRGVSSARNAGVRASLGTYVAFLDSDDRWHPGKVRLQLSALLACPEAVLCYGNARYVDARGRPLAMDHCLQLGLPRLPEGDVRQAVAEVSFLLPSTLLMERERFIGEVGGFDTSLAIAEDWDFAVRASRVGAFVAIQEPIIDYRRHPAATGWISPRSLPDKWTVIGRICAGLPESAKRRYIRSKLAEAHLHEFTVALKRRRILYACNQLRRALLSHPACVLSRARRRLRPVIANSWRRS